MLFSYKSIKKYFIKKNTSKNLVILFIYYFFLLRNKYIRMHSTNITADNYFIAREKFSYFANEKNK